MYSFNVRYISYRLNESLNGLNKNLKHIGTYYYERYEVYQQLCDNISPSLHPLIKKIEIVYFDKLIIGTKLYFQKGVYSYEQLKRTIDKTNRLKGKMTLSLDGLIYKWQDKTEEITLIDENNKIRVEHFNRKIHITTTNLKKPL